MIKTPEIMTLKVSCFKEKHGRDSHESGRAFCDVWNAKYYFVGMVLIRASRCVSIMSQIWRAYSPKGESDAMI